MTDADELASLRTSNAELRALLTVESRLRSKAERAPESLRAALARIRNVASDEVETIYAARGALRAIETVAAQALGKA